MLGAPGVDVDAGELGLRGKAGGAYCGVGDGAAVDLFRIANLILINRAQRSTGQSLAFGNLQQSIRDQLTASSARVRAVMERLLLE